MESNPKLRRVCTAAARVYMAEASGADAETLETLRNEYEKAELDYRR